MKRRLIVMRHCKSSWDHPGLSDHQRPLNKRGTKDAPAVAARLAELGWVPDRVVSSDAARTQETWAGLESAWKTGIAPTFTNALYGADATELAAVIARQPPVSKCLLVLGHNPGWEYFAGWLAGRHQPMTTGNAALLEADTDDWDLEPSDWTLVDFIRPREI
jgi:phosphohistidine phosphatase